MICDFYSSEAEDIHNRPKLIVETDTENQIVNLLSKKPQNVTGVLKLSDNTSYIDFPLTFKSANLISLNGKLFDLKKKDSTTLYLENQIAKGYYIIVFFDKNGIKLHSQSILLK